MDDTTFDFAIIGAGPAGEAATYLARSRGASVAVIDRDLFGGSCPFWACMPSKTLLHAAAVRAGGGDYSGERASARRDYMISRVGMDYPSDAGHVNGLDASGATVLRGTGRIAGPGSLGLETVGVDPAAGVSAGPDLRIADGVFLVGDPAGPEMHTHVAHYQGELAVRIALGDDVRPDYSAIPRAVYTDPEVAGVGRSLEDAITDGVDAFEEVADLATTARVMGGLFAQAAKRLDGAS